MKNRKLHLFVPDHRGRIGVVGMSGCPGRILLSDRRDANDSIISRDPDAAVRRGAIAAALAPEEDRY